MKSTRFCPVCSSPYTLYVHDVIGKRTGNHIPQYYCMDCNSLWNFSGYRESTDALVADAKYLIEHQNHIAKLQNQLFIELNGRLGGIQDVLEVGCGTGLFLKAAQYNNVKGIGFELNPYAAAHAVNEVGVDVQNSPLDENHSSKYDLAVAIGVFEHVETPRKLFADMVRRLRPGGAIYLNVPFVERIHWKYLFSADQRAGDAPPNPFYDNDVHIIHFSIQGLKTLGQSLGARYSEYFVSADVSTNSPNGAYPGLLFFF